MIFSIAQTDVVNSLPTQKVVVEGHTDSDGAEEHNHALSIRRAQSVSGFLVGQGVAASRLSTMGYGEAQPLADNTTTDGKSQNRRVEIAIYANKRMKKAAEKGQL